MELAGETAKEGGGGAASVRNVLSGGCPGSITFWGGDLGLVGSYVLESGGGARGITKADIRAEDRAAEWQRDGNWRSEAAEKVLREAVNHSLGAYIDKQKATVVEWVALRLILEVCNKDTGYEGGGR